MRIIEHVHSSDDDDASAPQASMTKGMLGTRAILALTRIARPPRSRSNEVQSSRGIKATKSRLAKRQGVKVTVYDVDDVVYVRTA